MFGSNLFPESLICTDHFTSLNLPRFFRKRVTLTTHTTLTTIYIKEIVQWLIFLLTVNNICKKSRNYLRQCQVVAHQQTPFLNNVLSSDDPAGAQTLIVQQQWAMANLEQFDQVTMSHLRNQVIQMVIYLPTMRHL
jgi:hypothetical protein